MNLRLSYFQRYPNNNAMKIRNNIIHSSFFTQLFLIFLELKTFPSNLPGYRYVGLKGKTRE